MVDKSKEGRAIYLEDGEFYGVFKEVNILGALKFNGVEQTLDSVGGIIDGVVNGDLGIVGNLNLSHNANINSNLNILGNTSIQSNLNIIGNTNISNTLLVDNNIGIGTNNPLSKLHIVGDAIITSNTNILSNLNISNNANINSNLNVLGNTTMQSNLNIVGNTNISDTLLVDNNIGIGTNNPLSKLHIVGDAIITSNTNILSNLNISNNANINSNLNVLGNATIQSNLNIVGNTNISDTLLVDNNIGIGTNNPLSKLHIIGDAIITNNTNILSNLNISKDVNINNKLIVKNNTDISGNLNILDNLNVDNKLLVKNNTDISGNLNILDNLNVDSKLIVKNNADILGNLNILDNININRQLLVKNNVNINSNLNIIGNTNIYSNLNIAGNANIYSNLNIVGNANITDILYVKKGLGIGTNNLLSNLHIIGDATITNNTNIISNLNIDNKLNIKNNANMLANLNILDNLNVNKQFSVGGNTNIIGNLNILDNLNVDNKLIVKNNTDILANLNILHNLNVNSELIVKNNANIFGNLNIIENFNIDKELSVGSNTNILGNLNVIENLNVDKQINVKNNVDIIGNLNVNNNLNVDAELIVKSNANVFGNLNIIENFNIDKELSVGNNTNIFANLNIYENLNIEKELLVKTNTNIIGNLNIVSGNLNINSNINILGNITGITTLDIINDVDITTVPPTNNQVLTWVDINKKWEPKTVTTTGGIDTNNVDLNGGFIDGIIIGQDDARNGNFTDIIATSLDLGINGIIKLKDNLPDSLVIKEDNNSYLKFDTTDNDEKIIFGKKCVFNEKIAENYINDLSVNNWNGKQEQLDFGINHNNTVKIDTSVNPINVGEIAIFTNSGIKGISNVDIKSNLSLDLVENISLSTWTGSNSITTLGTIGAGAVWNGSKIDEQYINDASVYKWDNKQEQLDFGITHNNAVKIDTPINPINSGEVAIFTNTGIKGTTNIQNQINLKQNIINNGDLIIDHISGLQGILNTKISTSNSTLDNTTITNSAVNDSAINNPTIHNPTFTGSILGLPINLNDIQDVNISLLSNSYYLGWNGSVWTGLALPTTNLYDSTSVSITGGNIDGTVIGLSDAANATFDDVVCSNLSVVNNSELGTITSGIWNGSQIAEQYIDPNILSSINGKQEALQNGISDTNNVVIDGTASSGEIAIFTDNGITGSSNIKHALNLDKVNNTSDDDKPISELARIEFETKVDKLNPHFTGVVTGFTTIDFIEDVDTSTTAPATGQVLTWDGTKWTAQNAVGGGTGPISLSNLDINDGTIDGVTIGNDVAGIGKFTSLFADSLNLSGGNIAEVGRLRLIHLSSYNGNNIVIDNDWSATGTVCSNLGTVSTVNIDGGNINGTIIGNTTPSTATFTDLTVESNMLLKGDTNTEITLQINSSVAQNANIIEVNSNDNLTKYFCLDKDGNVGISNNNPGYTLDIDGDINFTGQLTLNGSIYTGAGFQWNIINTNELYYNAGNVGIGTDNPNSPLHIIGSKLPNILNEGITFGQDSDNYSIEICSINGTESNIDFKKTNSNYDGRILYNHTDNTMKFYTNNTETFKCADDNNVYFTKNIYGGYLDLNKNFEIGSFDPNAGIMYLNKTNQRPVIIGDDAANTSSGLGIGISPEIGKQLDIYGSANIRGELVGGHLDNSNNFHIKATSSGNIYLNNGLTGVVFIDSGIQVTSDDRCKHNETTVNNCLNVINQLNLLQYDKTIEMLAADYIGDLSDTEHYKEVGFIAQDIKNIQELEFSVKQETDGKYSLNYDIIHNYTTGAVKELKNQHDNLKNEFDALKIEHETLKNQYNDLLSRIIALENN